MFAITLYLALENINEIGMCQNWVLWLQLM